MTSCPCRAGTRTRSRPPSKRTCARLCLRTPVQETVAGVPGMVAGMLRHLRSLRAMKADHGWINTLLDEAEVRKRARAASRQLHRDGGRVAAADAWRRQPRCYALSTALKGTLLE